MAQNISLLGATYSAVPAVLLPKQGGGTARFDDASVTTAVASDVASGKQFLAADGTITTGTASGGGGSSYELIGTAEVTANTTSTTATQIATITVNPSAWQHAKIIYVRIRDKAGKRKGYFYGNDDFFININQATGSTSDLTSGGRFSIRVNNSNVTEVSSASSATGYGVYASTVKTDGKITIYTRYQSSSSRTINGTYKVEVYLLAWPDGVNPLD